MESWEIQGFTVEYDDDSHTYLADGIIIPSVTQLMKVRFGGKYDFVNPEVLKNAANRGTLVHKAIENYCKKGEDDGSKEVRNFKFLMKKHNLKVFDNEIPVLITKDNEPICAGRLDLIVDDAVADIKTTSVLDKEYLGYQLNLYRIGYMQSYNKEVNNLYGVHLRGDTRKLVKIPVKEEFAWNIIKEFKEAENE